MVRFIQELQWRRQVQLFDEAQRKILLALSNDDYLWRSFDRLAAVTRLDKETLVKSLDKLMAEGWIRPSITAQSNEPIYGLIERVGPGYQATQQRLR